MAWVGWRMLVEAVPDARTLAVSHLLRRGVLATAAGCVTAAGNNRSLH